MEAVLGLRPRASFLRADQAAEALLKAPHRDATGPPTTDLGHLNPVLHHFGPVLGHHAWAPKAGGDDTGGHFIELSNGGTDCGDQVLLARLSPLGPDGAQALVGQHLLEQLLGRKGSVTSLAPPPLRVLSPLKGSLDKTEAQQAEDVPEPWIPRDSLCVHRGHPALDDPGAKTGGKVTGASASSPFSLIPSSRKWLKAAHPKAASSSTGHPTSQNLL